MKIPCSKCLGSGQLRSPVKFRRTGCAVCGGTGKKDVPNDEALEKLSDLVGHLLRRVSYLEARRL